MPLKVQARTTLETICIYFLMSQATEAKQMKLSSDDRTQKLGALVTAGWKEVDGRDAIQKVFMFKNFNQVNIEAVGLY